MTIFIAILCVLGIVCGQILFKLCAKSYVLHGLWAASTLTIFFSAAVLYAVTTLVWIWVLSRTDLGRIYPLMALAFILVPIASYFLFSERFNIFYLIGVAFIALGIVLTTLK